MSIIIDSGGLTGRAPCALENVFGSFSAVSTASYDANPQMPVRGSKYTGAFARSQAYDSLAST